MLKKIFGLVALLTVAAPFSASAVIITIDYVGEIDRLTTGPVDGAPALETVFAIGGTVTGQITFDTTKTAGSIVDATERNYTDAIQTFTIAVETYAGPSPLTFTLIGNSSLKVLDDNMAGSSAPTLDKVFFAAYNADISGPTISGGTPTRMQFHLGESDLSTLSSLALPTVSELLALASTDYFGGNTNMVGVGGEVARYKINTVWVNGILAGETSPPSCGTAGQPACPPDKVPEPAPLALLGLGLVGLVVARRRRAV